MLIRLNIAIDAKTSEEAEAALKAALAIIDAPVYRAWASPVNEGYRERLTTGMEN